MESRDETIEAIRVAAHDWHARIEAGEMTPAERQAFETWLAAAPRHRAAYERAAALWREVGGIERSALSPRSLRPLARERLIAWAGRTSRDGRRPRRALRFAGGSAVIAALLLALLLTGLPGLPFSGGERFETQIAETRSVALADGSRVTLGARSRVTVELEETRRLVRLRSGEAFFQVASDPTRPFVVEAGDTRVEALGTAFDLRYRDSGLRIAVAEGTVEVRTAGTKGAATSERLSAGQEIFADNQGALGDIAAIRPDAVGLWRHNRLVYTGARLSEVVADANRHHEDWIFLRDDTAAQLEITAVFDAGDIEGLLAALGEALPIAIRHLPGPVIMIDRKAPESGD